MLIDTAPVLIPPVHHYLRQNILNQLGWTEFTHCLEAYIARRQGTQMLFVDLFPTFACLAAGGSMETAVPITAAWLLFILSARIFDDLADGQTLAKEWHGVNSQTTMAMGLHALGAANSAIAQIPSGAIAKEISCAFNQGLALAAKAQQETAKVGSTQVKTYLSEITAKTGYIFAIGSWSGGKIAANSPCQQTLKSLYQYGLNIGIMDQIIDDCQDLATDLTRGVWTLPTIYALSQRTESARPDLLKALNLARGGESHAVETAVNYIVAQNSLAWCLKVAAAYQDRALEALKPLSTENTIYLVEYAKRNSPAQII